MDGVCDAVLRDLRDCTARGANDPLGVDILHLRVADIGDHLGTAFSVTYSIALIRSGSG